GLDHPKVADYVQVVSGAREAGRRVAIIGAGGIGFDVAELLTHNGAEDSTAFDALAVDAFCKEWGIDRGGNQRGGVIEPLMDTPGREVWLLQRKESKVGAGLAKTTGWIRRAILKKRGVRMLAGVTYERIDDAGLHITVNGTPQVLEVDTIVVCAGQVCRRDLVPELEAVGIAATVIGGANIALELDAKRAIDEGTRVAMAF
ncbi:MAG: FAD-dependent oxidoreductase, partial [Pseudomonadota bacterium]|nr:FAD-dependent oxidoreductase [Pseudomonadota bacterium]